MGVPKFFRYTSERYPCLNELVKQYQIPDFDNMYLDMNGIIHNCSHPDDSNPHFRITEEKIFQDIFHYLGILFQIIKPKKLFFMAIDGVAPRAKMNQQRGRRFRSAREAEKLEEDARAKGEILPTEKRFDSNCITPGTVFMARLHEQLRYFVQNKMSTDPLWSKVKVILSGHETPGEGEHKIMDYIRWARSQLDYDPNTRHCLYGLDADLIMLGMCTHEPHFALLREEVKFGKTTQRATSPEETNFYLLHLSLLREYLEQEFIVIKDNLPFEYDIEKIVDDWVLMGFLVGNDFIPNLPNMHISNDALPVLYKTYMTVLPTLDGYINESGDLNLRRFEIFMQELAKIDTEAFKDTYADLKYFEGKTGRRPNMNERKEYKPNNDDTFNVNLDDIKANKPDDELQALINATQNMFTDDLNTEDDDEYEDIDSSDDEATFNMEFVQHKRDYYMNKLDYSKVTDEVLASQAECYVRAIQWNLWYYYKGCQSWGWFYPHHYAPYISDIKGFSGLDLRFQLGEPFKPFEQLLAVLPAASKHLLPTPFHGLMLDDESPIVHYYPINFETDLNGKKNDWEAVVLIPFIDEANLLSAMDPCYQRLTDEERRRNSHGPMRVYNWTPESLGPVLAPEYFPPIAECHAAEGAIWRHELEVPLAQLKRGMLPNANHDLLFPGFPTMRHLKYRTSIKKCKVRVFDQPSRNENMIVEVIRPVEDDPPLETVAHNLLGKIIWVGWPHLTRAKVISVSNEKKRLHHVDNNNRSGAVSFTTEVNAGNLARQWTMERATIVEHNMNRLGIELGDIKTILHAVSLKGYKYIVQDNTQMVLEPEWCPVSCGYAYQGVVCDVKAYVNDVANKFSTASEAYPQGDSVLLLTMGQYYGCLATVVDSSSIRSGRIKVQVRECGEPIAGPANSVAKPYRTAHHAAAHCGISSQMLSRITGSVLVIVGERNDLPTENMNKINVGLNLKFNKKNQEVSGYTRRCLVSNAWLYSERCVQLVSSFVREFPDLFDALATTVGNDIFFESDLWPGQVGSGKLQEVQGWLKAQPHSSAARRECGSEALEPEELRTLAQALDRQLAELQADEKKVTLHVKWNLLYKPELHEGNVSPDPKADFKMYDRVICVSKSMSVPFGAKGTITAIYRAGNSNTVRLSDKMNVTCSYQVLFDQPFPHGVKEELFDTHRFYRMLPTHMLNISYGRKLRNLVPPANQDDAFTFNPATNVLRREDGHHSAFASYSPTKDRQTPSTDSRNSVTPKLVANPLPAATQDNSTELLKSLLKISEDGAGASKPKQINADQSSWRARNEPQPQPQVLQRPQQTNWRKESNPAFTNNNRPPAISSEWTNRNFKGQQPIPPFPNFVPFQQAVLPQYQSPQFQQRASGQETYRQVPPPQTYSHPPTNGTFPKHLPNVGTAGPMIGAGSLTPTWNHAQPQPKHSTPKVEQTPVNKPYFNIGVDRTNNPFVPLQVQASRSRRVQNPSGPTQPRKEQASQEQHQKPVAMQPQASNVQNSQHGANNSRPMRKKKPRIAANLPFQTD